MSATREELSVIKNLPTGCVGSARHKIPLSQQNRKSRLVLESMDDYDKSPLMRLMEGLELC